LSDPGSNTFNREGGLLQQTHAAGRDIVDPPSDGTRRRLLCELGLGRPVGTFSQIASSRHRPPGKPSGFAQRTCAGIARIPSVLRSRAAIVACDPKHQHQREAQLQGDLPRRHHFRGEEVSRGAPCRGVPEPHPTISSGKTRSSTPGEMAAGGREVRGRPFGREVIRATRAREAGRRRARVGLHALIGDANRVSCARKAPAIRISAVGGGWGMDAPRASPIPIGKRV